GRLCGLETSARTHSWDGSRSPNSMRPIGARMISAGYGRIQRLRSGVGLPAVMKSLGHTSPKMTMRYIEAVGPHEPAHQACWMTLKSVRSASPVAALLVQSTSTVHPFLVLCGPCCLPALT